MAVPGTMHFVEAGIIQGRVGPETSNNIIEKGLALRPKQSGSVVASTTGCATLRAASPAVSTCNSTSRA